MIPCQRVDHQRLLAALVGKPPEELKGPAPTLLLCRCLLPLSHTELTHRRSQMEHSLDDDAFRNRIRGQKRTHPQQVCCGWTLLLHSFKGEGPGRGNRGRMIFSEGSTRGQ